jgi:hypothetical protein
MAFVDSGEARMTLPDQPTCDVIFRISPIDIASPGKFPLELWWQFIVDEEAITREDVALFVAGRFAAWRALQDR